MKTFFLREIFSWEPLVPTVLSTARFDLHLATPPFFFFFLPDALFIPKSVFHFMRLMMATHDDLFQRAESELSTLKRTISACELYTILTLCLYSQTSLSHINTASESWGIIFLENKTCATSNQICAFVCFMGFFLFYKMFFITSF